MTTLHDAALVAATVAAAAVLIFCAVNDVRAYTIPNWACVAVSLCWLAVAAVRGEALVAPLATSVVVLALGAVLFFRGAMGGGDVKLMAAVALWCGPTGLLPFSIMAGLVGALTALLILSPARRWLPAPPADITAGEGVLTHPMPFGVAISAGGLWAVSSHLPALV